MRFLTISLQLLGILLLIPAVTWASLRFENRHNDGPSILFPGGELITGELYTGTEPDWRFTEQIGTVDLQLDNPLSSRLIWILEHEGRLFITSDYMGTRLGRLWKHWAVQAEQGDGLAVVRIDGVRYPRQLRRIIDDPILDGVVAKKRAKYRARISREAIAAGYIWVFELAPRAGG